MAAPPLAVSARAHFAGLDPGPQPVHQPLRLRVVRVDGVELAHRRLVRIDGLVVEDRLVDEFLARQIAVGIGDEIRVLRRHLGLLQIVDECVRLGDVPGVLRDREIVEPQLRALLRDRVADLDAVLRLRRALLRLLDVAGKADHEADLAGGQRVEIFRRMELAHGRPDLHHQIGGLLQIGLLGGVRIEAEIVQRRRQDVVGGIEHVDAAVLELGEVLRLEDDVPAVDLAVGAEAARAPS